MRLWLDGRLLIDKWQAQQDADYATAPQSLAQGRPYAFKLEYAGAGAGTRSSWAGPRPASLGRSFPSPPGLTLRSPPCGACSAAIPPSWHCCSTVQRGTWKPGDEAGALLGMQARLRLGRRTGVATESLFTGAGLRPEPNRAREVAQDIKRTVKAKYDENAWRGCPAAGRYAAQESRDALVAYLLPHLGFKDANRLYQHLLIDVEMDPCMETSRINRLFRRYSFSCSAV